MSVAQPALPGVGITIRALRDDGRTYAGITVAVEAYSIADAAAKLARAPGLSAAEQARARAAMITRPRYPREPEMEGVGWALYQFPASRQFYFLRDDGSHLSYGSTYLTLPEAVAAIAATPDLTATEKARLSAVLGITLATIGAAVFYARSNFYSAANFYS